MKIMYKSLLVFIIIFVFSCKEENVNDDSSVGENEDKDLVLPSKAQIEWQESEIVALFNYDLHVFDDEKYDKKKNRITPVRNVNIFSPMDYNIDQWVQSAVDMGAKIAILSAVHESGFTFFSLK